MHGSILRDLAYGLPDEALQLRRLDRDDARLVHAADEGDLERFRLELFAYSRVGQVRELDFALHCGPGELLPDLAPQVPIVEGEDQRWILGDALAVDLQPPLLAALEPGE